MIETPGTFVRVQPESNGMSRVKEVRSRFLHLCVVVTEVNPPPVTSGGSTNVPGGVGTWKVTRDKKGGSLGTGNSGVERVGVPTLGT